MTSNGDDIVLAINTGFLVTMSIIVFLMQAGFAFLEAGSVRAKNTTNILVKNIIDSALGSLMYWATGYAFGQGSTGNGFIGHSHFFLSNTDDDQYYEYFFGYVFAATAATIVSGAIAERTAIIGYFAFTSLMIGFVYPVVTHWVWTDNGWLNELGYIDFAGSSVVHCVGGTGALIGAIVVGPRIGRFTRDGVQPLPGHSTVLVALGFFILWFGFFAFNGGSEGGIAGPEFSSSHVSRAMVCTGISGASAVLASLIVLKISLTRPEIAVFGKDIKIVNIFGGYWSVCGAINGGLSGMVAICASGFAVEPWAAFVIGTVAGVLYCFWSRVLLLLHIDDPLDATAVHLFGGIWGIIAAGLFIPGSSVDHLPDGAILYGWNGDAFIQFGIQVIGVSVIIAWSAVLNLLVFGSLRIIGVLRVSKEAENEGLDFDNGEPAYPVDPALFFGGTGSTSSNDISENELDSNSGNII